VIIRNIESAKELAALHSDKRWKQLPCPLFQRQQADAIHIPRKNLFMEEKMEWGC
jgi:hypothetical protein